MAGLFITFEGIDGSGKSTQARLLAERLTKDGHTVVLTREPGGSPGAEEIRRLLVEGEPGRWSAMTEILLFNAARRDHLERVIAPAIAAGKVVICDRFADSTRVYQGALHPELVGLVNDLHAKAIGREPDLTILIDMDPEVALARGLARKSGEDRFELKGAQFQTVLRDGFMKLATENSGRFRVIDGNHSLDIVTSRVLTKVRPWLV
ncbi:MAG: dTMP kinase [Deltaproteobacteria bacterium]